MRKYLILFILIFIQNFYAIKAESQGLNVRPMKLDIPVEPGKRYQTDIELRNTTDAPIIVDIQLVDLSQHYNGRWKIISDESNDEINESFSCKEWLNFDPNFVDISTEDNIYSINLDPLEMKPIRVSMEIPRNSRGTHGAGIIAQTRKPRNNAGINIILRFLIPVFLDIKGTFVRKQIDILDTFIIVETDKETNSQNEFIVVDFINSGHTMPKISGAVTLFRNLNKRWVRITELNMPSKPIIPGVTVALFQKCPRRLPSGKYRIDCHMKVDGKRLRLYRKELDYIGDPSVGSNIVSDASINLEPTQLILEGIPGSTRSSYLTLNNLSEDDINVICKVEIPKSLEGISHEDIQGKELSCHLWTKTTQEKFQIKSNSKRRIPIIISFPKNSSVKPFYYCIFNVIAYYLDGQFASKSESLIIVKNKKLESKPNLVFGNISITENNENKYDMLVECENLGNMHLNVKCKCFLKKTFSMNVIKEIEMFNEDKSFILPMNKISFYGTLDPTDIDVGDYIISLDSEFEDSKISKDLPITVLNKDNNKCIEIKNLDNAE